MVLLSSAALRAHLPANDETRATAALAISTREPSRRDGNPPGRARAERPEPERGRALLSVTAGCTDVIGFLGLMGCSPPAYSQRSEDRAGTGTVSLPPH